MIACPESCGFFLRCRTAEVTQWCSPWRRCCAGLSCSTRWWSVLQGENSIHFSVLKMQNTGFFLEAAKVTVVGQEEGMTWEAPVWTESGFANLVWERCCKVVSFLRRAAHSASRASLSLRGMGCCGVRSAMYRQSGPQRVVVIAGNNVPTLAATLMLPVCSGPFSVWWLVVSAARPDSRASEICGEHLWKYPCVTRLHPAEMLLPSLWVFGCAASARRQLQCFPVSQCDP